MKDVHMLHTTKIYYIQVGELTVLTECVYRLRKLKKRGDTATCMSNRDIMYMCTEGQVCKAETLHVHFHTHNIRQIRPNTHTNTHITGVTHCAERQCVCQLVDGQEGCDCDVHGQSTDNWHSAPTPGRRQQDSRTLPSINHRLQHVYGRGQQGGPSTLLLHLQDEVQDVLQIHLSLPSRCINH